MGFSGRGQSLKVSGSVAASASNIIVKNDVYDIYRLRNMLV